MALLKKNTQASLTACQREHTECQVRIAEVHAARASALNDDPDVDVLIDFDRKIVAESAKLTALAAKIELLQSRLEREQSDRQRKEYAGKVSRLESEIATLEAPTKELAAAFKALAGSIERMVQAQESFRRAHPAGFLLPRFNLDRVRRALAAVVAADLDVGQIREIAGNFLEAEIAEHKAHIETLRADAPQSEIEQDQAA